MSEKEIEDFKQKRSEETTPCWELCLCCPCILLYTPFALMGFCPGSGFADCCEVNLKKKHHLIFF